MQVTILGKKRPAWVAALCLLALTALGLAHFLLFFNRELFFVCAVAMIWMFARGDIRRLRNLPTILLLAFVGFTAVSACWAAAGKFFLNQFSKLVPAVTIFLALVLYGRAEKGLARRVTAAVADVSALLALLSMEAVTTGLVRYLYFDLLNVSGINPRFTGARLFGVFGNSNVEATVFAIGVFFSLALLADAESGRERALRAVTLAMNAFTFLLALSLGAMACFAVAVAVYLLAAGKGRGAALARMLCAAVPTVALAFASSRFFNVSGALKLLPLALFLLNAAAVAALDRALTDRLGAVFAAHEKTLYGTIFGAVALLALYAVLAMRLSAPYTFGNALSRAVELAPGEHTLTLDADAPVTVAVTSKNSAQVLTGASDALYNGGDTQIRFTVPEQSVTVWLRFSADAGTTIRGATLDGETPVMLRYRLLPGFVSSRLQGTLRSNSSVMLRLTLWRYGLRCWRFSPVVGNGMGSFESQSARVQDFDYETKFPHNQYVQALLEGGVIGFALFLASLAALGAALWKRRRALREGEFAALYAAFAAEFVMNALQMLWDIQMTNVVFLCQTYALYALIVLTCAEPLGQGRRAVRAKSRVACALVPVFLAVTSLGNIVSQRLLYDYPATLEQYFDNLELAMKLDLYEYSDVYATYIMQVATYHADDHRTRADECAARFAARPSNVSSAILTEYYVNTQQFSRAIDAAMQSTVYSASDTDMWNRVADLLKQCFANPGVYSPLLGEDGDELLQKLLQYRDAWTNRNAVSLSPVTLTEENERFFHELDRLEACNGDREQIYATLAGYQPIPQNITLNGAD